MCTSFRFVVAGTVSIACILFAATGATDGQRGSERLANGHGPTAVAHSSNGDGSRGTLQYDDGVPMSRDGSVGPNVPLIGNQFASGLPSGAHTITAASFFQAGFYPTVTFQTIAAFGPPAGTTAPFLGFNGVTGLSSTGWWSFSLAAPLPVGTGSFLGAIGNTTFGLCSGNTSIGSTCGGVALGTGVNGLGHNGIRISVTGASDTAGSNFAPIPGQNALLRMSGTNIPVELMRFEVE